MDQDWPLSFSYDNSYKYQPSTNPGYKAFIRSPMNIMADLTAAMAEHSSHPLSQQEISPLTPVQTIIMTAAEKNSRHRTIKLVGNIQTGAFLHQFGSYFRLLICLFPLFRHFCMPLCYVLQAPSTHTPSQPFSPSSKWSHGHINYCPNAWSASNYSHEFQLIDYGT